MKHKLKVWRIATGYRWECETCGATKDYPFKGEGRSEVTIGAARHSVTSGGFAQKVRQMISK